MDLESILLPVRQWPDAGMAETKNPDFERRCSFRSGDPGGQ
jgi:hypothetical protein